MKFSFQGENFIPSSSPEVTIKSTLDALQDGVLLTHRELGEKTGLNEEAVSNLRNRKPELNAYNRLVHSPRTVYVWGNSKTIRELQKELDAIKT